MKAWLSRETVAVGLVREAEATARQLSHTLTGRWVHVDGAWLNRCIACNELAHVEPRAFRTPRVHGLAVQMRCKPR